MCRAFCARAVSPVQISRSVTDTFLARTHPTPHTTSTFETTQLSTLTNRPHRLLRVHAPARLSAQHRQHTAVTRLAERHAYALQLYAWRLQVKRVFLVTRIAPVNSQAPGRWQTSVRTAQSNSPGRRRIPFHHPLRTFLALEVLHHRAPPAQHLSRPCSNAPSRRRTPCAPSALRLVHLVVFQQAADYVVLEGHHINPCGGG